MNNIHHVRQRFKLSQVEFADLLDVGQSLISHYECDRHDPSVEVARRIIAAGAARGIVITFDDIYAPDGAEIARHLAPSSQEAA